MDAPTEKLLSALDPVGVELLLELLTGPLTEAELLASVEVLGQPTCNRRLHRLKAAGLVEQAPGKVRAPHRQWRLRHPAEIEAVLTALLALADEVEAQNRQLREEDRRRILRGRAKRLGIRSVEGRDDAVREENEADGHV